MSVDTGAREPLNVIRDALGHYLKAASSPHQWSLTTVDAQRAVRAQAALEALAAGVGVPPDAALSKRLREAAERWMPGVDFGPDLLREAADALVSAPARERQDARLFGEPPRHPNYAELHDLHTGRVAESADVREVCSAPVAVGEAQGFDYDCFVGCTLPLGHTGAHEWGGR